MSTWRIIFFKAGVGVLFLLAFLSFCVLLGLEGRAASGTGPMEGWVRVWG